MEKKTTRRTMARRRVQNRLRSRLAVFLGSFTKLLGIFKPGGQVLGLQRMCPSCGLITPRAQPLCLECGKPLRSAPLEQKDARQR